MHTIGVVERVSSFPSFARLHLSIYPSLSLSLSLSLSFFLSFFLSFSLSFFLSFSLSFFLSFFLSLIHSLFLFCLILSTSYFAIPSSSSSSSSSFLLLFTFTPGQLSPETWLPLFLLFYSLLHDFLVEMPLNLLPLFSCLSITAHAAQTLVAVLCPWRTTNLLDSIAQKWAARL